MIVLVLLTLMNEEALFIVLKEGSFFYCFTTKAVNILTL